MIAENNQSFAIKVEHLHFITKDKSKATSFVHIDKEAEAGVKIIKELKDPNNTHKFTMKNAIKEINRRLQSEGINFEINQYIFNLFNKVYGIKVSKRRLSQVISADYFRRKHLSQSAVNDADAHYTGGKRRLSRAYFSAAEAGLK